jgi:hypothetical protein
MAAVSPFFRTLPLEAHGLTWVEPDAPLAHPLDDGPAVMLERSCEATSASLGRDGRAYASLMGPLVRADNVLFEELLRPLRFPRHPFLLARFGLAALRPARSLARARFDDAPARALFAGCAAHSVLPLDRFGTSAFGLVLAVAGHVAGWPLARGGSQKIADALASLFRALGGEIETGREVRSLGDLPEARAILLDVGPKQLVAIAGDGLPKHYTRSLQGRLGAVGTHSVDGAGVRARSDGSRRGDARGDCRGGGCAVEGAARGAAVRARRAAEPLRWVARARGQAHRVGVLPRAGRLDERRDRRHRGADRAFRPGLP